jgi:hypothetical protein
MTAPFIENLIYDGSFERDSYSHLRDWALHITGSPTGGTFTLTVDMPGGTAQTTAGIAWNASAATIQAALEAMSNLAPGDVTVTAHQTAFIVIFAESPDVAITANSAGLTGGTSPTMTVKQLSVWGNDTYMTLRTVAGSHGSQYVSFAPPSAALREWDSPWFTLDPAEIISVGAASRLRAGLSTVGWDVQVIPFDINYAQLTPTDVATEMFKGGNWGSVGLIAAAAPASTAYGRVRFAHRGGGSAAIGDQLDCDSVRAVRGVYEGPMLPAMRFVGDPKPDGFQISAYIGLGCDKLRARIYKNGNEVDGLSPTAMGDRGSVTGRWAKTTAVGLEPDTLYTVILEARNETSGLWYPFGEEIL